MIRASETCGTITKDLTFMLSGSPRRREREWGQRSPQETMAENPPNLARHKPTDSRSWTNSKQDKEIRVKTYYNQTFKNQTKRKSWKQWEKHHFINRGKTIQESVISHQKPWWPEEVAQHISSVKRTAKPGCYI